jgi:integrase
MPKKAREMSAVEVKRLSHGINKKTGGYYNALHAVGGVSGLLLQVTPVNGRSWILRTNISSKRRSIGIGGYPDVSLASARELARKYKQQISEGIDPIEARLKAKRLIKKERLSNIDFASAMYTFMQMKAKELRSPRGYNDKVKPIEKYALPVIGSLPVREIELVHIKAILDPIWLVKTETASRLRSNIEAVLSWCAVNGYRTDNNPAKWKGYLDKVYQSPEKIKVVSHHKALSIKEMPHFMNKLRKHKGSSALALEFTILTAARTNEVIGDKRINKKGATWQEIDFDNNIWTIPASRMKANKEHTIPLSNRAMEILRNIVRGEPDEQIFKGQNSIIPSDQFMTSLLKKRMGYDAHVHGFRSTFKDWAREKTDYPDEWSEIALAHINSDVTRAAYARSSLLNNRREMMNNWELFCNQHYICNL